MSTRSYLDSWKPTPRPAVRKPTLASCEFCKQLFNRTGRPDRPRRTCSVTCAGGLRKRQKQQRALARFRAARACRFLAFPTTA